MVGKNEQRKDKNKKNHKMVDKPTYVYNYIKSKQSSHFT